jgi:hypothetical protein
MAWSPMGPHGERPMKTTLLGSAVVICCSISLTPLLVQTDPNPTPAPPPHLRATCGEAPDRPRPGAPETGQPPLDCPSPHGLLVAHAR